MTELEKDNLKEQKEAETPTEENQAGERPQGLEETASEGEKQETASEEPEGTQTDALKEANEKYMRLAADFQNYKRRTENERKDIAAFANERIVKELLNVIDSFERALETAKCEDDNFRNGVELIYKQFVTALAGFGVEVISTEGEFDPNFHNAVMSEEVEGEKAGKILMVMQKGYTLNGKVIRPSMVKVSV